MLQHVPSMDLRFDGDCAQEIGLDLPVVVINLPHRTDRWDALSRRMSEVGLTKLIRAPAIEGVRLRRDPTPENIDGWRCTLEAHVAKTGRVDFSRLVYASILAWSTKLSGQPIPRASGFDLKNGGLA
jgi:hypothetical protein